jgi:phage terminase small subunit
MKLTPKQEKFAQAYIECGNASEAYRQSYDAENMKAETINRSAKELMDNHKITARVAELLAEHKERHNVTVDSIVAELDENRAMAMEDRNPGAANQSTLGKAKVTGNLVERHQVDVVTAINTVKKYGN